MSRRDRRRVQAALELCRPAERPLPLAWRPYEGDGRCDTCPKSATQALVRVDRLGVSVAIVRVACASHR